MPAGLGLDDIVRVAMAAYGSSKEPTSSSRDHRDRSHRDEDYDRNYRSGDRRHDDRDRRDDCDHHSSNSRSSERRSPEHHSSTAPDPFSELIRMGTQELGRLVRKFEKKAKHQDRAVYDDRFVEELGSDVDEHGNPYSPPQYNSSRDAGAYYPSGAQPSYEETNDYMRQKYMPHDNNSPYNGHQPSNPLPGRGAADSYYGTGHSAAQSQIEHQRRQNSTHTSSSGHKKSKSSSKPSLRMLARGGLDIGTIMQHLPMLLERAEAILGMLDSGSRSAGKGGKGMNYISALRAAVILVRKLYTKSYDMNGRR